MFRVSHPGGWFRPSELSGSPWSQDHRSPGSHTCHFRSSSGHWKHETSEARANNKVKVIPVTKMSHVDENTSRGKIQTALCPEQSWQLRETVDCLTGLRRGPDPPTPTPVLRKETWRPLREGHFPLEQVYSTPHLPRRRLADPAALKTPGHQSPTPPALAGEAGWPLSPENRPWVKAVA